MSGDFRAVVKVGVGRALYRDGFIETSQGLLEARSVNVDLLLSMLSACFSKSLAERLNVNSVEVVVELYEDLDALLDGDLEHVNKLKVVIKSRGLNAGSVDEALSGCPFYVMLKPRIELEVEA